MAPRSRNSMVQLLRWPNSFGLLGLVTIHRNPVQSFPWYLFGRWTYLTRQVIVVSYLTNSLWTGQVSLWALTVTNTQPKLRSSFPDFMTEFHRVLLHLVPKMVHRLALQSAAPTEEPMELGGGHLDCFIDPTLVRKFGCPVENLNEVKRVCDLDGGLLAAVKQITGPLILEVSGNHVEKKWFFIMTSHLTPVVLGLPWLQIHNPTISWDRPAIVIWSSFCYAHCLRSAVRSRHEGNINSLNIEGI